MVDLNAHEAGNGGQSQGKPTTRGVLLYSECEGPPLTVACEVSICWPGLHPPAKSVSNEKRILFSCREREAVTLNIGRFISTYRPLTGRPANYFRTARDPARKVI